MGSWNNTNYVCRCGKCASCLGEVNRKGIYKKPMPAGVREQFAQKIASQEETLFARGYIKVPCPKCGRDRQVLSSSLKNGFRCDVCGYTI